VLDRETEGVLGFSEDFQLGSFFGGVEIRLPWDGL
jgi:hypothetical protein